MLIKKIYSKLIYESHCILLSYNRRKKRKYNMELPLFDEKRQFSSLNSEYEYFHHYFWNIAPTWLKHHREYFSLEQRAFGEDAFHAMWYHIFKEFKPKKVLEIGIYRGSTLSLFSLLSQKFNLNTEVHGISPFSSSGDTVSKYLEDLDYYDDVKKNFDFFNLPIPFLYKGYSTDIEMVDKIQSEKWDMIFIDGNHDYEVVKHDFIICSQNLNKNGLIILDDAALNTEYKSHFYSTAGHPGPSKVASEIDKKIFIEILSVGHNRVFKKII